MSDQILFSIIIANFNKGDNIHSLLASIYADGPGDDFEVFFMDDASIDDSVAAAEKFPVLIRRGETRLGPARLRNLAAREARGEYLLFVDSDVILPYGTLHRFRELCRAGDFGAVSGLEVLPPVINNWIGWFRTLQVQDYFDEYRLKEGHLDAWGSTLGGVRREIFFRAGGFNEAYRGADVEDHALAVKLRGLGSMIFSPQMTYRHSYPCTIELIRKQFRRAFQMIQLEQGTVIKSSLLYHWRFKAGHILSVAVVAVGISTPFASGLGYVLAGLCLLKLWLGSHLFLRALQVKGPLFMVYTFCMSLIMGVSIVCGAIYGKSRRVLP